MKKKIISIGLVDDDKLIVELMADFLQKQEGMCIVMKAYSGNEAAAQLKSIAPLPDILIMDLKMEDGDGMELLTILNRNYPQLHIIVLSSFYRPSYMGFMLKSGVSAFIPKETDKHELLKTVEEVYHIGHYFTPEQVSVLRGQITHKAPRFSVNPNTYLSDRELEVLELICQQYTAKEISDKLYLSSKTVESHKCSLLQKTGAKNTAGLIIFAIQHKLVNPDDLIVLE